MDSIDYQKIYIKYKDGVDSATKKQIVDDLYDALIVDWSVRISTYSGEDTDLVKLKELLTMTFDGCIFVVMFMSFFSLSASMSANLYGQTKEIGILRSIGLTNWQVSRIYFYEAIIVV